MNINFKLRILILSNLNNEDCSEDILLANSFIEDGNEVLVTNIDFDEKLDDVYDIFLRRSTWVGDESEYKENDIKIQKVINRLKSKNKLIYNFGGIFDSKGKDYLYNLYKKGYPVIPTAKFYNETTDWNCNKMRVKPLNSYDGFDQIVVDTSQIKKYFNKNYLIQPNIKFESEIQFYFVDKKFYYALEFIPSKVPTYPTPKLYLAKDNEIEMAKNFIKMNALKYGMERVDFIKTPDKKLLLLEIEDCDPYLDLEDLIDIDKNLADSFIVAYKKSVYDFYKTNK
ncbi:hypothetical protein SDC9_61689 [bioreactor metagenome]|uniref:ATP-grasp domain-containing protein n=1 Tax=bioreactor metagenome TaxID=1076179 RepID=A0A644XHR4_9ZZZZ